MAVIAVLATIAIPNYIGQLKHAREAVLREDLHVIRAGIDAYTMKKSEGSAVPGRPGADGLSADDSCRPYDPHQHFMGDYDGRFSAEYRPDEPGVNDVHSGATDTGSDGQPYSTW